MKNPLFNGFVCVCVFRLWMYCGHLLQGPFVPVDQQCPRLQQDTQCVLLNAVKQLLKCRGHLAVRLPPHLIININRSPRRGEEIGGVKELKGEDMRGKVKRGEERIIKLSSRQKHSPQSHHRFHHQHLPLLFLTIFMVSHHCCHHTT